MIHTTYAIIGSGPAAFYAAGAIRKRDPAGKLVMIGAEGHPPYYRPLISYYLAGQVPLERLFMKEEEYYRHRKIDLIGGVVTAVKGREKTLAYRPLIEGNRRETVDHNADARQGEARYLQFEKLLIASGGAPVKPDLPGINTPGVYFFRTIKDAARIAARAKDSQKALLLGGGLVNLKAAYALHKLGLATTLVIASNRVLSQMLDQKGAGIVAAYLQEKGIKLILQNDVVKIQGNSAGVTGVTLANGQELETDLIVVGKGVKPCTPFLEGSGIGEGEEGGVAVDEHLQANLPDIYAAGDAALCRDLLLGTPANNPLWPNATAQGEIAGANMAGERLTYRGSLRLNAAEFFGLPVIAAGLGRLPDSTVQLDSAAQPREIDQTSLPPETIGYIPAAPPPEIYELEQSSRSRQKPHYLRLVFQKEHLVGYVSIGENRKAGMLTNLIAGQTRLAPQQKEQLINGNLTFPLLT